MSSRMVGVAAGLVLLSACAAPSSDVAEPARSDTASATSMRGYAYRAVPSSGVGTAYCGDETGMVCSFDAQTFASDRGNGGRCPNVCDLVQP